MFFEGRWLVSSSLDSHTCSCAAPSFVGGRSFSRFGKGVWGSLQPHESH